MKIIKGLIIGKAPMPKKKKKGVKNNGNKKF